jgi:hypothetical protein
LPKIGSGWRFCDRPPDATNAELAEGRADGRSWPIPLKDSAAHSILTFAFFTTVAYFSVSLLIVAAISAGVLPTGSAPISAKRF